MRHSRGEGNGCSGRARTRLARMRSKGAAAIVVAALGAFLALALLGGGRPGPSVAADLTPFTGCASQPSIGDAAAPLTGGAAPLRLGEEPVPRLPYAALEPAGSHRVSQRYIRSASDDTGAVNAVSAVLLDYRAFDTLGEIAVMFAAVTGIVALLSRGRLPSSGVGLSPVVKRGALYVPAFMFLSGAYIALHGHISPGGGFQAGVIFAAISVILCVVYGTAFEWRLLNPVTKTALESGGAIAFMLLGFIGPLKGLPYLTNLAAGLPKGHPGSLASGGYIPLLNAAIAVEVGAGLALAFYSMIKRLDYPEGGDLR